MGHPLGAVVFAQQGAQHLIRTEPRGDALEHQREVFADLPRFGQQAQAGRRQRADLERQQLHITQATIVRHDLPAARQRAGVLE